MLDSDLDDFDDDDSDKDPDYNNSAFEDDSDPDQIEPEENDDALSGIYYFNDENINRIDSLADISHISGSEMSVDSSPPANILKTNRYAAQLLSARTISPHARLNKWHDTNECEIKQLFGLLIWTGLVSLPSYHLYWSLSRIYCTQFSTIMSRNRFECLMKTLHFSDNTCADPTNRLYKLGTVINDIMINSNYCMQPEQSMCIDESLVKFMGRLAFKQYIKNKRDRFGIKEFKLCISPCYTIAMKVYCGKEVNNMLNVGNVGSNVVMELAEPYLDNGRTIFVDNWYSSVELAELLQSRNTYLVGTLRCNRKSNPKEVTKKKFKKREIVSQRSSSNVLVLKWRDKRDLVMISSKHDSALTSLKIRGKTVQKPTVVVDNNIGKTSIDLSDQMTSYSNPLRRSQKWYRKVALDALLNISVVNALVLFQKVTSSKISITEFRSTLVEQLINKETITEIVSQKHTLEKSNRSRCVGCYSKAEHKIVKK
ncbi:piggyBac transposable element-derived protein 4-like [Aphis gossypii]|uniref:piggyBac transposable element-derived protein 4-like n=1 Tax=Aphis gossypii TaxID=80765 RepID=UPI0021598A9F|nr:piggyBac transposable element-derived protein 4-like [Aphis gossypii]